MDSKRVIPVPWLLMSRVLTDELHVTYGPRYPPLTTRYSRPRLQCHHCSCAYLDPVELFPKAVRVLQRNFSRIEAKLVDSAHRGHHTDSSRCWRDFQLVGGRTGTKWYGSVSWRAVSERCYMTLVTRNPRHSFQMSSGLWNVNREDCPWNIGPPDGWTLWGYWFL